MFFRNNFDLENCSSSLSLNNTSGSSFSKKSERPSRLIKVGSLFHFCEDHGPVILCVSLANEDILHLKSEFEIDNGCRRSSNSSTTNSSQSEIPHSKLFNDEHEPHRGNGQCPSCCFKYSHSDSAILEEDGREPTERDELIYARSDQFSTVSPNLLGSKLRDRIKRICTQTLTMEHSSSYSTSESVIIPPLFILRNDALVMVQPFKLCDYDARGGYRLYAFCVSLFGFNDPQFILSRTETEGISNILLELVRSFVKDCSRGSIGEYFQTPSNTSQMIFSIPSTGGTPTSTLTMGLLEAAAKRKGSVNNQSINNNNFNSATISKSSSSKSLFDILKDSKSCTINLHESLLKCFSLLPSHDKVQVISWSSRSKTLVDLELSVQRLVMSRLFCFVKLKKDFNWSRLFFNLCLGNPIVIQSDRKDILRELMEGLSLMVPKGCVRLQLCNDSEFDGKLRGSNLIGLYRGSCLKKRQFSGKLQVINLLSSEEGEWEIYDAKDNFPFQLTWFNTPTFCERLCFLLIGDDVPSKSFRDQYEMVRKLKEDWQQITERFSVVQSLNESSKEAWIESRSCSTNSLFASNANLQVRSSPIVPKATSNEITPADMNDWVKREQLKPVDIPLLLHWSKCDVIKSKIERWKRTFLYFNPL